MISRRTLIAALGATTTLLSRGASAAYPEHPIRMVVPFAAGGNADIVARIVSAAMSATLGQPIVIDNRAGAGGSIGAEAVARSEPDGYTLLVGSNGPLTVNPFVQAKLGYDPLKDFAPIALTSYVPHAIIVYPALKANTVAELVALTRRESISIGTSGVGSATHLTLERFNAQTGAKLAHIPYRSGGALLPDLIAGNIQAAMTELSTAAPLHHAGQGRLLAVAAERRSELAPEVPTMIESGVSGFTASSFIGIVAPAATPPVVVGQLQAAVASALRGGPAVDKLRELGAELATIEQMTPAGFQTFIQIDFDRSREAAKLAGLTPQ
jgi:tripartite-type tricarboxylate transporter receptor subunit TctC